MLQKDSVNSLYGMTPDWSSTHSGLNSMCRLKEQLALYTPVKFKAFWPSANSGLDEELNSDLHKWGLLETEPSWSHSRDLAVAPILI